MVVTSAACGLQGRRGRYSRRLWRGKRVNESKGGRSRTKTTCERGGGIEGGQKGRVRLCGLYDDVIVWVRMRVDAEVVQLW
jgi:hypothetical protein